MLTQSLCAVTRTVACLRCKSGHRHPNSPCVRIHAWCHGATAVLQRQEGRAPSSTIRVWMGHYLGDKFAPQPVRPRPPPRARPRCGTAAVLLAVMGATTGRRLAPVRRRRRRLSARRDQRGGAPEPGEGPPGGGLRPPVPSSQTRRTRPPPRARCRATQRRPATTVFVCVATVKHGSPTLVMIEKHPRLPSYSYRIQRCIDAVPSVAYEVGADPPRRPTGATPQPGNRVPTQEMNSLRTPHSRPPSAQ